MKLLDLTIGNAAADVALDEALLETAESGDLEHPLLRIWQPTVPIVVLGRSSPFGIEINHAECDAFGISIVRRCSGGATILTSPGCLMYAVLLSYQQHPELRMIDNAHEFVMNKIRDAVSACGIDSELQGICDLTINDKKVSGNALRCKRRWFIYHGTLICQDMDLSLIARCLGSPKRQPEYRANRSHADFLTQIPVDTNTLTNALVHEWQCEGELSQWPEKLMHQLVEEKYTRDFWTEKI